MRGERVKDFVPHDYGDKSHRKFVREHGLYGLWAEGSVVLSAPVALLYRERWWHAASTASHAGAYEVLDVIYNHRPVRIGSAATTCESCAARWPCRPFRDAEAEA